MHNDFSSLTKTENADENEGEDDGEDDNEPAPAEWGAGNAHEEDLPAPEGVVTGEEEEKQVFQTRAKLFKLVKQSDKASWSEVGVGPVRVNVPIEKEDENESSTRRLARIIMRRQGVLKLLLNTVLVPELVFEIVGDNMLRFACESFTEEHPKGELSSFLLKFGRTEERNQLLEAIYEVQPTRQGNGSVSNSASSESGENQNEEETEGNANESASQTSKSNDATSSS